MRDAWFWVGDQSYEYVDLGRLWQLLLVVGVFLWLFLMGRALWPALRRPGEHGSLLVLFLISSLAIAQFYAAGLGIWQHTQLAMAEYWRWWVVHLATRHRGYRLPVQPPTADPHEHRPILHLRLPERWDHRHLPPTVLLGYGCCR